MTTGVSHVDWDLAVSLGSRIAGDGPVTNRTDADAVVAELRSGAARSTDLVRDFTGLDAGEQTAPVVVVDRAGWIRANADGFARLIDPVIATLIAKSADSSHEGGSSARSRRNSSRDQSSRGQSVGRTIGAKVAGAQLGVMFGFLGGKVLGQFDPFCEPAGRLLLVAPNILHVERELRALPADFRLWVCLHEETHRVQFTAVPWMRDHVFAEMTSLLDSVESSSVLEDGFKRISESFHGSLRGNRQRGSAQQGSGGSLIELMSTPEQVAILDRLTGVMSLLEGHADVVMDGVGPSVIPSVGAIRAKFNQRRKGAGSVDRLVRRLLGLDAKMAQYRDGAKFVREVVDKVGMSDFNAVWAAPANLPSKAEIHDPATWITRIHG
jgi:coenzyme F420 biosynthesis associated uncharacterized protein